MRHTSSISFAFLRRHYPDQVRGTGTALRPDLSRLAPAPLGIVEFYYRFLNEFVKGRSAQFLRLAIVRGLRYNKNHKPSQGGKTMKRCFIYAAGTFYGLREPPRGGDLQIAADAGLLLCERLGVRPDVVLGDFDSMDVRQAPADCIRVPVEKDDTDTMLALREGGCQPGILRETLLPVWD